jgi:hypothetical protein
MQTGETQRLGKTNDLINVGPETDWETSPLCSATSDLVTI